MSTDILHMFDIRSNTLDEAGNRLVHIELTAVRTHFDHVRRVVGREHFGLIYTVVNGEHVKSGAIDLEQPELHLVFEHGVDPDGAWRVTIEAVDDSWRKELWRQDLFVQNRLRRSHDEIDELARRYAPVFLFSLDEEYFPVSLETLLCSPILTEQGGSMKIKTIFGREHVPVSQLGEFLRFNGHCDYLLDFDFWSMRKSIFKQIGGDPKHSSIYYSYLEDPDSDRFFITYHLIFAYDTKTGIARWTGVGQHVFDRESLILVFDSPDAPLEPSGLIISGHLENQTIIFLNKLKVWTQGRIRVPWDDPRTLKLGTHPIIAVAEGSHALYPTSGVYQVLLLSELAGYLDPNVIHSAAERQMRPEQILVPPNVRATEVSNYALHPFGFDRLCSHIDEDATGYDPHNAFLVFSGYWVDVPGPVNARFPPFTRKVADIGEWVDGAYAWEWDDVPDSYHDNGKLILRVLQENREDF